MPVIRGQLIQCYLSTMKTSAYQAAVFELPGNREALEVMLDTMRVTSEDRERDPDSPFAILAVTPAGVGFFRPVSMEELLHLLDMLCAEAAPEMLYVWMKASPGTEERILAHMSSFPNQMAPGHMQ